MRRCGRKFGEILDVVWMQQILKCDVPHAFDNQTEKTGPGQRKKAIQEYRGRGLDARIARSAAEVEGTYYGKLTRVEEIIAFANRIGAKRIGLIEDLIAALASALG